MRNRNSVKQLGRTHSHRKMMFNNMVTSLFKHERIVTTKQKGKVLKRISEKLITRAKKNLELPDSEVGKKLHNKREVLKVVKDRDVMDKLFNNIAPRFKERKGGYTRIYLLGTRPGDSAEMVIVELVDREVIKEKGKEEKSSKESKKDRTKAKEDKATKDKKEVKAKDKEEKKDKKKDKEKSKDKK